MRPVTKVAVAGVGGLFAITTGLVAFIAGHEGTKAVGYLDPVGIPTVCTGHTATAVVGERRTQAECADLLRDDLSEAAMGLRCVKVPVTEGQFNAFVSFVFNVGAGNFCSSTMVRKLNAGDYVGACRELPKWVYAKGQKLPGLVRRRAEEMRMCLEGLE